MKKTIKLFMMFITVIIILPTTVSANDMSEEFKKLVNDKKQMIVNSIKPTTDEELYMLIDEYALYNQGYGDFYVDPSGCNTSYTLCGLEYLPTGEYHNIEIVYKYDKDIKEVMDNYINLIPEDLEYFSVNDMEVVNFWVNTYGDEEKLISYSSELKSYFDYKNFTIDLRMGDDGEFKTEASGIANFLYNDTVYGIRDNTGVRAKHVIYVPDTTGNTKEELINAAQKRIDEYVGEGKVELSYKGQNIYNFYVDMYNEQLEDYQEQLDIENAKPENEKNYGSIMSLQNQIQNTTNVKNYFIEDWAKTDGEFSFLKEAEGDYYFEAKVKTEDDYETFMFIIVKDSSKMVEPLHKTADLSTNIEITTESNIPLDTTIKASKLTEGEEYEKIVKLLNLTDNLTYDLKLYSNSTKEYVTKLENGTFEVRIPIPESFKDKDLVVYYVDDTGKIEPFTVKPENNYAVFTTNHFSIYTLGYEDKIIDDNETYNVIFDANGGKFEDKDTYTINNWHYSNYDNLTIPTREGYKFIGYFTTKNNGTSLEHYLAEAGIDKDMTFYARWEKLENTELQEENPKTSDNILTSIIIATISLIGLTTTGIYLKKQTQ